MSVYRDDQRVPTTIFEAAAMCFSVRVCCSRCPNAAIFEPASLWWYFQRRHLSDHFSDARERFYCMRCAMGGIPKVRPLFLQAVREKPSQFLEPPDDRAWKRAIRRFRT